MTQQGIYTQRCKNAAHAVPFTRWEPIMNFLGTRITLHVLCTNAIELHWRVRNLSRTCMYGSILGKELGSERRKRSSYVVPTHWGRLMYGVRTAMTWDTHRGRAVMMHARTRSFHGDPAFMEVLGVPLKLPISFKSPLKVPTAYAELRRFCQTSWSYYILLPERVAVGVTGPLRKRVEHGLTRAFTHAKLPYVKRT